MFMINVNMTSCRPIQSVIIRVITKLLLGRLGDHFSPY